MSNGKKRVLGGGKVRQNPKKRKENVPQDIRELVREVQKKSKSTKIIGRIKDRQKGVVRKKKGQRNLPELAVGERKMEGRGQGALVVKANPGVESVAKTPGSEV